MRRRFQFLPLLLATAVVGGAQESSPTEAPQDATAETDAVAILEPVKRETFLFPSATTSQYETATGDLHVYLVQEPEATTIASDTPILIYMHGRGGREEQGMKIFPSLRSHLNELGWIYVCPRDNEYAGLLREPERRYGRRKIYLSGASAGARWALWEAERHSERYAGLILMCPAVRQSSLIQGLGDDPLQMPVWIVCGEKDETYAAASRWLTDTLKERGRPVHYTQLRDGDHNAPCRQIKWEHALAFIEEYAQLRIPNAE